MRSWITRRVRLWQEGRRTEAEGPREADHTRVGDVNTSAQLSVAGTMLLLWVVLCSALPHLTHSRCVVNESSSWNASPLLDLQCENDYETSVNCSWTADGNAALQLWLQRGELRQPCEPYQPAAARGRLHCRVETRTWAIGITHTFFFLKREANCSSAAPRPVHLLQQLRARPPVDLSSHGTGDGGRRISWSCPYPPSSSLSSGLRYQLSYRPADDDWTTENVSGTSLTLDRQRLLPGHAYEARVRSRARLGQWSRWSPVVTWRTPHDAGQPPLLHCELDGDTEVTCSWDMSGDLARIMFYELTWRQDRSASPERRCVNPTVRSDPRGAVLRFSCSLTAADPAHLLLELQPRHSAKTFNPTRHIVAKPPQKVKLKEEDSNWVVEWTKPHTPLDLDYEVCFYRTHHQEPRTCRSTSVLRLVIPAEQLVPSQDYELLVRSLLVPGEGTKYEGRPSEWVGPEKWTSHPAPWSVTYVIYVLISLFVAAIFLVFYCVFHRVLPACQRRVVLWVDSVPSPGKSKILSEIQSSTSRTHVQSEDTSMCKVLHFDADCSSHVSLWPLKTADVLEPDEGVWNCNNLCTPEEVPGSDTSSMSFSGPYIFCQTSQTAQRASGEKSEEVTEDRVSSDPPSPAHFALFGDGYVCLPSRAASRSTQDLVSNHNANKQDQRGPDAAGRTGVQPELAEVASRDQPPAYTPTAFSPWPQGGQMKASGYCFLPTPK
ncbi:cytokine receptor common subunit beta [Betta splendens]|uniref:Cytokine receptor common subunit beta n=1 Tax=Betta splendens TaxID=158456 RepID=A0A6P7N7R2_BETSP|nr:cytokine receptor common subunit beta [Betta splendens]